MSDWFTDLVARARDEVLASDDVRNELTLTDQVTAEAVKFDITGSRFAEVLSARFAEPAARVRELDARREETIRELLPGEWRAVAAAQARVAAAEDQPVVFRVEPGRTLMKRWLQVNERSSAAFDELEAAKSALSRARKAFEEAAGSEPVRQHQLIREVDAARAEELFALQGRLTEALALEINAIIDRALTPSFNREFSYVGSARLADQSDSDMRQVSAEVNREAIQAIQNMIDNGITGAVGVAGPRGIGKTTLLTRFARGVDREGQRRQWGVCVAAPAQYDARDFLLHLFGQVCVSVLGEQGAREAEEEMARTRPFFTGRASSSSRWLVWYTVGTAVACLGVIVGLLAARPVGSSRAMIDLLTAACCAVLAVMAFMVPFGPPDVGPGVWWRRYSRLIRYELRLRVDSASSIGTLDSKHQAQVRARVRRELLKNSPLWIFCASAVTASALFALVALGSPPNPGYVGAVAFAAASVLLYLVIAHSLKAERSAADSMRYGTPQQVSAARAWYQKVKFQQSFTTGWSGTVTLAPSALPVQAQVGWSGSKAVTPLAMSIPEIVTAFQSLIDLLRLPPGLVSFGRISHIPVVVGIDEVDKIEDPQVAQAFFNQIKGLFGDAECLFLISISDDAMAAYERRGLPLRDAFDSSLSRVIALSYLSREEARTLIGSRLVRVTEPGADLLYVLSGGLPRELVRLIYRAVELQRGHGRAGDADRGAAGRDDRGSGDDATGSADAQQKPAPVPLDALAAVLIADEVAAQRRAVLTRGRFLEACNARDKLLAWAGDAATEAGIAGGLGASADAVADYFTSVLTKWEELMTACDDAVRDSRVGPGGVRGHADACASQETGAFLFWLATVGQVLGKCATIEDFADAERPASKRSFERLARARQNFSLGPGYVITAVQTVRDAWGLTLPTTSDG